MTDSDLAEKQERQAESLPARTTFTIWSLDDCLEERQSVWSMSAESQREVDVIDELEASTDYWNARNPPLIYMLLLTKAFWTTGSGVIRRIAFSKLYGTTLDAKLRTGRQMDDSSRMSRVCFTLSTRITNCVSAFPALFATLF